MTEKLTKLKNANTEATLKEEVNSNNDDSIDTKEDCELKEEDLQQITGGGTILKGPKRKDGSLY